jgi:predicted AlkP superfamily phosphohydrolase/phosphomutase
LVIDRADAPERALKLKYRIIIAVVLLLLAGGLLVLRVQRGGRPGAAESTGSTSPTLHLQERAFSTWDDFLAFRDGDTPNANENKVVFIGVDGAAWSIIDPMIEEGILPNFERLKREGSYGTLRSVQCYVSPPAWASMMTGYLPEKTGIYTFGHWDRSKREFLPLSSEDVLAPSVWDVSSLAGKRTAVVNVPITYPVREVDGIMVSGLLTPAMLNDRSAAHLSFEAYTGDEGQDRLPVSHTSVMTAVLEHFSNRFDFFLVDSSDDGIPRYDRVSLQLHPLENDGVFEKGSEQNYSFKLGEFSPWMKINLEKEGKLQKAWCKVCILPEGTSRFSYMARFSHVLFSAGDSEVTFTYPDSLTEVLQDEFSYYFPSKFLDREIVPSVTDDAARFASFFYGYDDWDLFLYVFTQSDNIQHLDGVSPITKKVYQRIDRFLGELKERLPQNSTLVIASDHGFKGYTFSIDLNKFFEHIGLLTYTSDRDIDYEKTLVFHNLWCIYFNRSILSREELRRRGINLPPEVPPREGLMHYIEQAGKAISVSSRNARFPLAFNRVDTTAIAHAPDMIVKGTYSNYLVEYWNLKRPRESVIRQLRPDERWNHTREGIYLLYGKGVKHGVALAAADIQDIATTMLFLLGLPMTRGMDGKVMADVFAPDRLAVKEYYTVGDFGLLSRDAPGSEEERGSLEKKLRSLGYVR